MTYEIPFRLQAPVQTEQSFAATTWIIGCFNIFDGIEKFNLINKLTTVDNLNPAAYC